MKKLTKIIMPVLLLAVAFASCDKNNTSTTPTTTNNNPTPTTPTAPTPVTPAPATDFWGVMVALKMKFAYSVPQITIPVSVESEMAIANFYSSSSGGTTVDVGKVAVNSNDLKNTNNSYTVTATTGMTPSTLSLGSSVQWVVDGGNGIPAINYTHSGAFPDYSGTVPTTIDRSKDLEIDLGGKVTGADSVYVVVVTSGKTIIKAYNGSPAPAKATISASELSGLPAVSDNTAYLEVVPFRYILPTLSGKRFVFIKETAVVSAVNIN